MNKSNDRKRLESILEGIMLELNGWIPNLSGLSDEHFSSLINSCPDKYKNRFKVQETEHDNT